MEDFNDNEKEEMKDDKTDIQSFIYEGPIKMFEEYEDVIDCSRFEIVDTPGFGATSISKDSQTINSVFNQTYI